MKKYFLTFIVFFSACAVSYASFPVIELSEPLLTASSDTSAWGIVAICCGVLGLFIPFLGIPALIFGAMGLKKKMKGLAIAGLILGLIEVIILLLVILALGAVASV
jgi:hypothetical protein